MKPAQIPIMRARLMSWYRRTGRDLPWRRRPTLYRTLVAEFMLQQTRTDQAMPYYRRFLRAFPSMKKLAAAKPGDVLKLWEGLGYYRRATQLHQAARRLAAIRTPTLEDVAQSPGVGAYTEAAIGSIVFGRPLPVVDGNVRRVASRLLALDKRPDTGDGDRIIRNHLQRWISQRAPATWNQAIMELGARVCTPRDPKCTRCPVQSWCRANQRGEPEAYPLKRPRGPRPHHHIAAAVIHRRDGRILIAQRLPDGLLPNLWEFPGGKQEPGESLPTCCRREIREELGIGIRVGRRFARIDHAYSHYSVTLHFFECRHSSGHPRTLGCQAFRWVRPGDLARFAFPRANWPVVNMLNGR